MYKLYTQNLPISTAAKILRKTEIVADAYAEREIKQLQKMKLIKPYTVKGIYQQIPHNQYENMLQQILNDMRTKNNGKTPEQIREYLYNLVKDMDYNLNM